MFCQTSMEAVIPALMDIYFRYDDMANSYLYLAAGLELIGKHGRKTRATNIET